MIYGCKNEYAPVAQLVEHLTFNQGVRSSILRRSTKGLIISVLSLYRDVAQLVARMVWDHDAAGSNPVISTISSVHNRFKLWTLDIFLLMLTFGLNIELL